MGNECVNAHEVIRHVQRVTYMESSPDISADDLFDLLAYEALKGLREVGLDPYTLRDECDRLRKALEAAESALEAVLAAPLVDDLPTHVLQAVRGAQGLARMRLE